MKLIIALFSMFFFSLPTRAEQPALTPAQQDEVRRLVEDVIRNKPEALIESLQLYQEKRQAEASAQQAAKAKEILPNILKDKGIVGIGNPKGDVTVIEFFDYNCGYCKKMLPVLQEILKEDKKVRWVFIDLPILAESSTLAAKAAAAAEKQGKFIEMHMALLEHRGQIDNAVIETAAKAAGMDIQRLQKDMADTAIDAKLARFRDYARTLGISGTPGFIIGENFAPGAMDADTFRNLIATARKQAKEKKK
jgi:protein-disulfide isomerase